MQKLATLITGLSLFLFGLLSLTANLFLPAFGIRLTWLEPWRYWPLFVLGLGTLLFMLGLLSFRSPGWGALFIPAIPINVTGALLFAGSVFDQWHVWNFGWAFIILGLAVGFLFAAVAMRNTWLGIPAIIIGINGLVMAFCSITGLWSWWSVLWTIEPLSVGLILLLVAYKTRSRVVTIIGGTFTAFSLLALVMMGSALLMGGWGFRLMLPMMLVFVGGAVLLSSKLRGPLLLSDR